MYGYPLTFNDITMWDLNYSAIVDTFENSEWYYAYNHVVYDSGNYSNYNQMGAMGKMFKQLYGEREIIIPDTILNVNYINDLAYKQAVSIYLKNTLGTLYMINDRKYEFLWKALIKSVYNPIWNVDGTETTLRARTNTGTVQNELEKTGKEETKNTIKFLGSESDELSGTDEFSKTGTIDRSKTGTDTLTKSGTEKNSTVPMESTNFYDTDKVTYDNRQDSTMYNTTESEGFTNYKESYKNGKKNTKSFSVDRENKNDTSLEFTNRKDTNTRSDNLAENETITLTRQGNIGVTKSQDLVLSEIGLRCAYELTHLIFKDIANSLSYMC